MKRSAKFKLCRFFSQRLSAAVHYGVGKFSEDLGRDLGVQFDKSVVAQVANITFERLLQCGSDLEAFAR